VDGRVVKEKGRVIRNEGTGERKREDTTERERTLQKERGHYRKREDTTERRAEGRAVVLKMTGQNMKRSRR